jgi:hypothetical protein
MFQFVRQVHRWSKREKRKKQAFPLTFKKKTNVKRVKRVEKTVRRGSIQRHVDMPKSKSKRLIHQVNKGLVGRAKLLVSLDH